MAKCIIESANEKKNWYKRQHCRCAHRLKVFKHRDFGKAVVNTLLLNVLDLLFSFPMPIILALLLNEIRVKWFKRVTQTLLYLPHFLSWVVIGATAYAMFATNTGVVNTLIANAGHSPIPFLQEDAWWLFSYVLIGILCSWASSGAVAASVS